MKSDKPIENYEQLQKAIEEKMEPGVSIEELPAAHQAWLRNVD